jgi:hypothetical protein
MYWNQEIRIFFKSKKRKKKKKKASMLHAQDQISNKNNRS